MLYLNSDRKDVCSRLPWLGSVSTRFEKQVKSAVKQCFSAAVKPRLVLYQRASARYQQRCTACFAKKQRDLSVLMPLRRR